MLYQTSRLALYVTRFPTVAVLHKVYKLFSFQLLFLQHFLKNESFLLKIMKQLTGQPYEEGVVALALRLTGSEVRALQP